MEERTVQRKGRRVRQRKRHWLPMLLAVICWLVLTVFVIQIVLIQLPLPTDAVIENVFSLSSWTDFLAGR